MDYSGSKIAVIGLGYVGMPLAAAFAGVRDVIGFDISPERIEELRNGFDRTREVSEDELKSARRLTFTCDPQDLRGCDIFLVAVPTPVDKAKRPDMSLLQKASTMIGGIMRPGAIVVYESTVYPGATEEICAPVLAEISGLTYNTDFFCGYSPERINPGDKTHGIRQIVKVTSGSTPQIGRVIDALYGEIIDAGTHPVSSIAVAEAAKVIENTQRDVNIALVNELAIIFNKLEIDTAEILKAAGTKWNFIHFRPGLVGGHCIGVDPYYLTHKAQEIGHHPEIILAGRRMNDYMATYVAEEVIKLMLRKGVAVLGSRMLILGLTFKENCPDLRNTKVAELVFELQRFNAQVDVYDPWIDVEEARDEHGIDCLAERPEENTYDAVVLAVPHREFLEMDVGAIRSYGKPNAVIFDIKSALPRDAVDGAL